MLHKSQNKFLHLLLLLIHRFFNLIWTKSPQFSMGTKSKCTWETPKAPATGNINQELDASNSRHSADLTAKQIHSLNE